MKTYHRVEVMVWSYNELEEQDITDEEKLTGIEVGEVSDCSIESEQPIKRFDDLNDALAYAQGVVDKMGGEIDLGEREVPPSYPALKKEN